MSAIAGIRAELTDLYKRRAEDAKELDKAHRAYEKARIAFEAAQRPVFRANERIEALALAWAAITTDDFPVPTDGGAT